MFRFIQNGTFLHSKPYNSGKDSGKEYRTVLNSVQVRVRVPVQLSESGTVRVLFVTLMGKSETGIVLVLVPVSR